MKTQRAKIGKHRISEDEFDSIYKPVKNHIDNNASFSGYMFETFNEELCVFTEDNNGEDNCFC